MNIFTPLYDKTLAWAEHKNATWFLGGMSFAESSFFPIPVDVMLAPMTLRRPEQWMWLAFVATALSVIGGLFGYLLGALFWDAVQPWVESAGKMGHYNDAVEQITRLGAVVVFLAAFTPLPYKVVTIASGTLGMALFPFVIASILGRGLRFYLVAGLVAWAGPKIEPKIHKYIERIGWACIILVVVAYLIYRNLT